MSQVAAARGPVEVADLGPTYMHEHIFNAPGRLATGIAIGARGQDAR